MQIPLRVYSSDNKLIAEFGEMRRTPDPFRDIPPNFINAFLSAEDDNFANHDGVDPSGLVVPRGNWSKADTFSPAAPPSPCRWRTTSSLTSERSFTRKTTEILLARKIERQLTKDEILELYVNKIYLGNRAYGIEAAAPRSITARSIRELSAWTQMAMMAGLPRVPVLASTRLANPSAHASDRRQL